MLTFHRSVHISLWPTKAQVQVLHPGHSGESHPKEKPVHWFNSRGHCTHGQGNNTYDICSDVFFQIHTREQESSTGTGFPPGTSISLASIFPSTLHTHLYLRLLMRVTNRRNVETFRKSKHFWVSKGVRKVGYWTKQYFHTEMKAVCRHSHILTHRLLCPCSAFRPQLPRVHPSGAETQTALNVRFNSAQRHSGSQAGDSVVVSTPCSTDLDTVPSNLFIRNASSNAQ